MSEVRSNWSDTQQRYLSCSNEDERVVESFTSEVLPKIQRYSAIDWLEVGPGPGSKTFALYRVLLEAGMNVGSATFLEPDPNWTLEFNRLAKAFKERYPTGVDFAVIGAGVSALLTPAEDSVLPIPNLITCIHVLYDEEILEAFGRYLRILLSKTTSTLTAFVVIESEESDFYRLRQRLAEQGFHCPANAAPAIKATLRRLGIPFETKVIGGQTCNVSQEALSSWFPLFLLGVNEARFSNYSREEKHALNSTIEDYLIRRPGRSLNVPDIAFIVSSGKLQYD